MQIIGVRPYHEKESHSHTILEGVNADLVLRCSDHSIIDRWTDVEDKEALHWTSRIIKEEGMLVGSTSGAALKIAVDIA